VIAAENLITVPMELSVIKRTCLSFPAIAALVTGLAGTSPALADPVTIVSVQTGHSIVVDAPHLNRIAVGDSRIAGVVPIGTSQLVVNGKAAGHTTVFVWSGGSRRSYEVTVTEQGFDDIAKLLRSAINEPDVQVVAFDANLLVRGSVPDSTSYNRLNDIIDRFKGAKFTSNGKANGTILNTVTMSHPLGDLQQRLNGIPGATNVRVDPDPKGNLVVSGTVRDRATQEAVLNRVKGLAGPYLSTEGKIVDRLETELISQVDVKVYVLEVDRTASSQLGLRLQTALQNGAPTVGGVTAGGQSYTLAPAQIVGIENPNPGSLFGKALAFGNIARATLLAPTLDLLMSEGHAKILSSPDLMTVPGVEATFLVGGKIPIPISSGLGTVSVQYQDFGVKLKVTPTLLADGSIDCKVNPEVSNLDFADAVTLNGFTIPAIKISTLNTEVITQTGDSIVMGGLLNRMESVNVTKIPLLGDIPILGKLFRSTAYQKSESDVIFILTPTVVTR
jgi:Flp pilus assembly secretin CpaC